MKRLLRQLEGRTLWRLILVSWVLLAGAAGLAQAAAVPAAAAAAAALLVLSWTAAVRFLLADSWGRWFWLWWFAGAGLMAGALGAPGVAGAVAISGFGLTVRRYRPWRHIGARRRALGFGLGLLAGVLLVLVRPAWTAEPTGLALVLRNLGGWALGSLAFFWFWSLFHLAVRMQLHFLRLRPKLAVSAFLIGVVPLLLAGLLAAMMLYTGLGGARASGAGAILESWRTVAAEGSDLAPALFDTVFVWPDREATAVPAGAVRLPAPPWTADLARQLSRAAPHDTTAWVAAAGDLWLMRWQGLGGPEPRARAWLLGQKPLTALSKQLRAGLVLTALGADNDGANVNIGTRDPVRSPVFDGRRVMHRDVTDDPSFWSDWRYFGGTLLEVLRHREGRVDDTSIFVTLRVGWTDLRSEFLEGEDNLNVAVVIALGLVAALFLVIEIFALFFGVRITEGIIAAVRSLGRGTRAVAAGDLDATITLPNEDEFGDLAADFNAMTRAVKKGRQDALARERLTRELQTAREIQERLLPHDEPAPGGLRDHRRQHPQPRDRRRLLRLHPAAGRMHRHRHRRRLGQGHARGPAHVQPAGQPARPGDPPQQRVPGGRPGERPAGGLDRSPHVRHLLLRGAGHAHRRADQHQRRAQPAPGAADGRRAGRTGRGRAAAGHAAATRTTASRRP